MKARLISALAALPDLGALCWVAVYPIAACLSLNLALSQTSQGAEIIAAVRAGRGSNIAVTVVALVYCALACRAAALLGARSIPRIPSRLASAVGFWAFTWVLLSAHATLVRDQFPATSILLAMVGTLVLLPLIAPQAQGGAPSLPTRGVAGPISLLVVGLLVLSGIIVNPVLTGRTLGPWALVNVAFGFWPLLATAMFVAAPRRVSLPALTLLPLLFFVAFRNLNDNHQLRVTQNFEQPGTPTTDTSEAEFRKKVREWLVERCKNSYTTELRPCPVFFVAAEGGGIRAAHWTALVLDHLDVSTEGRFYDHLFAISGVSGGSIGAAAYVTARVDGSGKPTGARVDRYFGDDYLSPLLASFLFTDFLQRFLPFRIEAFDRATAFERGLEESWEQHFGSARFRQNFLDLWAGEAGRRAPALFLNATNVETGKRFIVSNLVLPPKWRNDSYFAFDPMSLYQIRSMPMSAATHASARFPFVSPPAVVMSRVSEKASHTFPVLETPPDRVVWGRLVDGGYFEVSGAATVNDLMNAFAAEVDDMHRGAELPAYIQPELIVVVISNDPQPKQFATGTYEAPPPPVRPLEPPPEMLWRWYGGSGAEADRALRETSIWATAPPGSEFLSPITAFFATRDARATREKRALAQRVDQLSKAGQIDCIAKVFNVPATTEGLRLLTLKSLMAGVTGDDERIIRCTPLPAYEDFSLGRYLNNSLVEHEAFGEPGTPDLSSPGLGWFLSERSRRTMRELVKNVDQDMYFRNGQYGNFVEGTLRRYYNPETVTERMERVDKDIDELLAKPEKRGETKRCEELSAEDDLGAVLHAAIVNSDERLVECVLKKGANADYISPMGETVLYLAAANDDLPIVAFLLQHGANPNTPSTSNRITPLHEAAESGPETVRLLLAKHADVNASTDNGITPLMVAAQRCNSEAAKWLLAAGADASRKDDVGRSAITFSEGTTANSPCESVGELLERAPP